jgi:hypothetical protein
MYGKDNEVYLHCATLPSFWRHFGDLLQKGMKHYALL